MKENGSGMSNRQTFNFVEDWLEEKRIKEYFKGRKKGKERYIRIKETDLYELCYKIVDLIKNNLE